jgi:ParB family chromosome partitioning protein
VAGDDVVTQARVEAAEVPNHLEAPAPAVVSSRDLRALQSLAEGLDAEAVAVVSGLTEHQVLGLCERLELWDEDGEIDAAAARIALHQFAGGTIAKPGPQIAPACEPAGNTIPAAVTPPTPQTPAPAVELPDAAGAGARCDQQLLQVAVGRLKPDPDNPRDDDGDVSELAISIQRAGLLQPIVCRRTSGGQLIVVAGHRRLAAVKLLGWATVAVVVRADMRPDEVLAAMLIENGQRKDLDPIEEARALSRLMSMHGFTSHRQLAERIGRTQVHVSARLALLALSPSEQAAVRSGEMSLIEATHQARLNSGRVRAKGQDKGWHLGPAHPLAHLAKARCQRMQHGRGRTVGGLACGECWESVLRADERAGLAEHAAATGHCSACGHDENPTAVAG